MTDAVATFDLHAHHYNAARRRLIPPFQSFYGTAVRAVSLGAAAPRRVLDLGAGTGLLSGFVRAAHPRAELTLIDGSARMLEQARELLGADGVEYLQADLGDALPAGPWDAVISALAIHHLEDAEKRNLFVRVREALAPGGVFVNAEQVSGPSERFSSLYATWQEESARTAGSDDAEWAGALERMTHDRCASAEDQLTWLREAGFPEADCLFKDHRFAVMVALTDSGA
jgi:tRNA (cmo5U34)-methyltransferase